MLYQFYTANVGQRTASMETPWLSRALTILSFERFAIIALVKFGYLQRCLPKGVGWQWIGLPHSDKMDIRSHKP